MFCFISLELRVSARVPVLPTLTCYRTLILSFLAPSTHTTSRPL